jgi:Tol biopolymer transport system component
MTRKATPIRLLLATVGALALALGVTTVGWAASAKTTRISVGSSGEQANNLSLWPSVSADGRYVAFFSAGSNLVPGARLGIFVRDRKTGTTRLAYDGGFQPSISADGRFVAFSDDANVFVYDLKGGKTRLVSQDPAGQPARGFSASPSTSGDGRYIAFSSDAKKMTAPKPTARRNAFVRDMKTGKVEQVNVSSAGKPGNGDCHHPSISANGRYVAFESNASNLVKGAKGWNIFVHDLKKHNTRLASVSSAGKKANAASHNPSFSGDGRYVAFESKATNLVKRDTNKSYDIFRRDLVKHETVRVSVSSSGKQANGDSRSASISNHGGFIAFYSRATNLVKGDTNHKVDVFFRNERSGKTVRVSLSSSGKQANGGSHNPPSISADGRFVAFASQASNLVPGDTNDRWDAFLRGPLHG